MNLLVAAVLSTYLNKIRKQEFTFIEMLAI